ncbi:hypothetical protein CRUP_028859 [Coryphaenoides rupestris]|nr:hypothetical protein CRUP_028859 [Coryphaenoides rupestris]
MRDQLEELKRRNQSCQASAEKNHQLQRQLDEARLGAERKAAERGRRGQAEAQKHALALDAGLQEARGKREADRAKWDSLWPLCELGEGGKCAQRDRTWSPELARAAGRRECCAGAGTRKDPITGGNICAEGSEWAPGRSQR